MREYIVNSIKILKSNHNTLYNQCLYMKSFLTLEKKTGKQKQQKNIVRYLLYLQKPVKKLVYLNVEKNIRQQNLTNLAR